YMRMPSPRHPPSCFSIIRPPPTPTLFPYTTLFRSHSLGNQKHSALYNYHRTIYYNPKIDSTKAHQVCPYVKSIHQNESKEQGQRSEEHTSEFQSRENLVCRLLLEKKKNNIRCQART